MVMRLLYSVTTPAGVIFPIVWLPLPSSVNHTLPSGPAARKKEVAPTVIPLLYSVITPAVVIFPIRLPPLSVNL